MSQVRAYQSCTKAREAATMEGPASRCGFIFVGYITDTNRSGKGSGGAGVVRSEDTSSSNALAFVCTPRAAFVRAKDPRGNGSLRYLGTI